MAEQKTNVEDIKAALVTSGILKAATIGEAEREKIQKALADKGVKAPDIFVICSTAHYCIVIKRDWFIGGRNGRTRTQP